MIKEQLTRLHEISFNKEFEFWNKDPMWQEDYFPATLLYHFETELEKSGTDRDLMIAKATAFCNDILDLKESLDDKLTVLDFVQFQASTLILDFLSRNKIFPYCFDWINNSISNEINTETKRDFQPYKILDFIESKHPYIVDQIPKFFAIWTTDLFYYSRSTGGHNELATGYIEIYYKIFLKYLIALQTRTYVFACSQLMTWAINHGKQQIVDECGEVLNKIYQDSEDEKVKKLIAFQFGCLNQKTAGKSKNEWCQIVIDNYSHLLFRHEKFQILVNRYDNSVMDLVENIETLLEEVRVYSKIKYKDDYTLQKYNSSKMFSLLDQAILLLVSNGRVEEANKLVGAFFSIPDNELIEPSNLYIIPNTKDGIKYCFDGELLEVSQDILKFLPELIKLQNDFLGSASTFNNYLDFEIPSQERHGVPNMKIANSYFKTLADYFDISKVLHNDSLKNCKGLNLLFGISLPIQQLIIDKCSISIPINQSFYAPLEQRKLKKVFIWQGYTQLAEYGRIGLTEIFEKAGIEVIFKTCFESNREEFLANYHDKSYDLVWVFGHGEFHEFEPHTSYFDLGNEIRIYVDEFQEITGIDGQRRLLVLDTCDAGKSSLGNSPASIGLGLGVINKFQSLMGHVWPVENYSSLILGLLLGINLAKGLDYAKSHYNTVNVFRKEKDYVLSEISQNCSNPDVLERIENSFFEYHNLYYWGSLCYFI